jgi:type IV secretory pathway VirB4 component
MLKLARNALAYMRSFIDGDGNIIRWKHIEELQNIQEQEGLNLANKLSSNHIQFQSHKMKVSLVAQTLSCSVADAIEFWTWHRICLATAKEQQHLFEQLINCLTC